MVQIHFNFKINWKNPFDVKPHIERILSLLAHVFFDDAFQAHGDDDYEYQVNDFVKLLVSCMNIAARWININLVLT